MELFLQIIILCLALIGFIIIIKELCAIYTPRETTEGRTYILCVPQTDNIEELCSELLNKYRRMGLGEDILICGENLSEENKKIGSIIETADKGIYFITPEELPKIVR